MGDNIEIIKQLLEADQGELMTDETRRLKDNYMYQYFDKMNIHMNLYDENEGKMGKRSLITWNDKNGKEEEENSPRLVKCEGCERNIGKKIDKEFKNKECLIYIENEESGIIKKRIRKDG
ncbi:hypothetical protein RhiirA4_474503 [Rhizophagus irregularis]|uniref:Uncharacterized protein n=1 Tax=Rhizophagus irregularis TaxID=588596 RepID=A0A2I1H8K3_9GLOM|nr:hypothetical protein RhiirA4_474503 [Rhizophagus irregularis]